MTLRNIIMMAIATLGFSSCAMTQDETSKSEIDDTYVVDGKTYEAVLHESHMSPATEFCKTIQRGIIERKLTENRYFGVPHPIGDKDFTFPKWKFIDPHKHIKIVEEMFLWGNVSRYKAPKSRPLSSNEYYKFRLAGKLPDDIRYHFLEVVRGEFEALIDDVEMWTTQFDVDMDGEIETVYRMTPIVREIRVSGQEMGPPTFPTYSSYKNVGLPGPERSYFTYVNPEDAPLVFLSLSNGLGGGGLTAFKQELFFWRGKPYVANGANGYSLITPPIGGRGGSTRPACSINIRLKK